MAEPVETPEVDSVAQDLRGKLLARLAVAGGLVAVLLGVLAFFDHLANPSEEVEAPVFTKPIPVAPRKEVTQPVTPSESLPEPPAPAPAEPVAEPPAAPATPAVEPPPPPVVSEQPALPAPTPPARSAASRPAGSPTAGPGKLSVAPQPSRSPAPPSVPEVTSSPGKLATARADSAAPEATAPTQAEVRAQPPVTPPSGAARLFSGFLLQAGVFSSVQHAEELSSRLNQSGVRATLETRVQVGPFRTRQEAEAAQAKLRQLGVETIIVPPKGKN